MELDAEWMDCAPSQWCHMKLKSRRCNDEDSVSHSQHWTFMFETETCLVKARTVLNDSHDVARSIKVFTPKKNGEEL
jgi:hypothetical protein